MMYFVLGRASLCPVLHFKLPLAPLRAEWWRWSVLSSWTRVMLLFFFLYGVLSAAQISHWSKLPLKFPSMKWNLSYEFQFRVLAYHHLPILTSYRVVLFYCCGRITANLYCTAFYFILFYFYSSMGETSFSKKAECCLQMRTGAQFDGRSGVDSEVKIGAGSVWRSEGGGTNETSFQWVWCLGF